MRGLPLLLVLAFCGLLARTYPLLAVPLTEQLISGAAPVATAQATAQPQVPSQLAPFFTPPVQRWAGAIAAWSTASGLPANLIATVIQIESCGDPSALSSAGALGLMQVMPYHFEPQADPLDPPVNMAAGIRYLARSYDLAQGDIADTLAGYNGGHGVIHRPPGEWSAETQRYAHWGLGIYEDARQLRQHSPTLDQWLAAGGHSLCQQAGLVAVSD